MRARCRFGREARARVGGALSLLLALIVATAPASADESKRVAPYAPSHDSVVDAMLTMAGVGPQDHVIDLGSGDGRLVIAAARRYGARGLGVDIDAKLNARARDHAAGAGVADRVRFLDLDLFEADVASATVVTVYLFPAIMAKVGHKLGTELAAGTRVIVHDFPIPGWRSERIESFDVPEKHDSTWNSRATLYLYRIPPQGGKP